MYTAEPNAQIQAAMGGMRYRPHGRVGRPAVTADAVARQTAVPRRDEGLATLPDGGNNPGEAGLIKTPSVARGVMMDVTVAICTWNRARLLDATLAQMCKLRVPAGLAWELVVVDNGSTDATPAVVDSYVGRLPIRRALEPNTGIANARNCALRSAKADLLLFTDDDVIVDEEWLNAYAEAAKRWPDAAYFGGAVTPLFETDPPRWIRENAQALGPVVGLRDLGTTERVLDADEPPFGANVAFRRNAFSTHRYDPRLGRTGGDQINGEDTMYCRGLAAAGFRGVYVPTAKVEHVFVAERMTPSYVRAYWVGAGRTEVRLGDPAAERVPRWVYRALLETHAKYFWHRMTGHRGWVKSMIRASRARGAWLEYRENRRGRGKGRSLGGADPRVVRPEQ